MSALGWPTTRGDLAVDVAMRRVERADLAERAGRTGGAGSSGAVPTSDR